MNDRDIIALYNGRNENAVAQTKEKYGKRLFTLSLRILKNKESAEECENDTYIEAWTSIPPKDPGEYFYPYLARITRHISLDRARKDNAQKRNAPLSEMSLELERCIPGESTESSIDERLLAEIINSFLSAEKPEARKIFVRRYFFLESIPTIAKKYSISESKVKSALFRSRNRLKQELERQGFFL